MNVLLVSPYHGGSHQSWADGYRSHSEHTVEQLTLPARFWKWRMHGGAVTLARRFLQDRSSNLSEPPDIFLVTDMLDLTTFLALTSKTCPGIPAVLYMHENQLTYPLPRDPHSGPMRRQKGERDLHYAFINYASMLVADRILFNSHYHRDSLLQALPRFLRRFPEYNEEDSISLIREKSHVLPVGLDLESLNDSPEQLDASTDSVAEPEEAPLILWNQRWEYDKDPATFFQALYRLKDEGIAFRLALCGEDFRRRPHEFEEARSRLASEFVHVGFAAKENYRQLLWAADVVVSTAIHEFFGISILEAIYCHTFPILPARLSYPELLPSQYHSSCLYEDNEALLQRMRWALLNPRLAAERARTLAPAVRRFSWDHVAGQYDSFLAALEPGLNKGESYYQSER